MSENSITAQPLHGSPVSRHDRPRELTASAKGAFSPTYSSKGEREVPSLRTATEIYMGVEEDV